MKKLFNFTLCFFRKKKTKTFMYDFGPQEESNNEIMFRTLMHDAINFVRKEHHLFPCFFHCNFSKVAIQHSKDMAAKQKVSHDYWTDRQLMFPDWHIGEILGYNYRSVEGYIDAFLKSEKHKRILLDATYTHVGIGSALDTNGKQYVTIIFGK